MILITSQVCEPRTALRLSKPQQCLRMDSFSVYKKHPLVNPFAPISKESEAQSGSGSPALCVGAQFQCHNKMLSPPKPYWTTQFLSTGELCPDAGSQFRVSTQLAD